MRSLLPSLCWAALISLPCIAQGDPLATAPAPSVAASVEPAPLTLQAAVAAALANHPELRAANREVEALEAARQQAGVWPNPTLGVEVEDTRRATRATTVQISQPLELGGKRSARVQAALHAREAAVADLDARRADVRSEVVATFFEALVAQERQRLAEATLQLSQRGTQAVNNRVTAGKVSPIEATRAQVAEAGVRMELAKAASDLAMARQRLASAMAVPEQGVHRLDGSAAALPTPVDATALRGLASGAPALRRARADVERSAALVDVERGRRMPDLAVTLGAKRDAETQRQMAVVGLSMPFPLFDRNQGGITEALRRQDKARDELAAAELRWNREAATAAEQLRVATAEAEILQRDVLPGALSAYEATVTGYELGKFGLLDVLDAQRSLLQARTQHLQALASAHRAAAEASRLIGDSAAITSDPK